MTTPYPSWRKHPLVLAISLALPAIAAAQDASPQRVDITGTAPREATDTAPTATRSPVPIDKTPQSVVVLSRSLLDEQGARTVTEGLGNVASVRGTDARDILNFGLRIRGFEAGVLVDGVALPGQAATPELTTGISRIEVVKGPAGTLFGGSQSTGNGGFIGGLVSIVTAAPTLQASTSIRARAGTRSQGGLALDLNQPLGSTIAVRLAAEGTTEDSETDRIRHKRTAIQPSLAWRPSADAELVLRWRHTESEGLDFSGLPRKGTLDPAAYAVPRTRIIAAQGMPETTSQGDVLNLQWRQRLSETWSWELTAARVRFKYDQRGTFPLDSTTFGWPASSADGPYYALVGARLWMDQTSTVISPSVTGKFQAAGARHTLTAGLEADRTRDDGSMLFSPFGGLLGFYDITGTAAPAWAEPVSTPTPDQQNRYRSTSVYVQDHADFGAFQFQASIRQLSARITDVNPAFFVNNHSKHDKTLGRLGAVAQLSAGVSAFAGWGQGMRVPTYAVLTLPAKPEISSQSEIGLRLNGLAGLSATIAAFDLQLENALQADPVNLGQSIQVREKRSRGLDIDLQWQLGKATRLLATLARITTEVVDTGKRFVDVPQTTARIAVRHDLGAGSLLPGLGLGIGMNYHSALPGDAANTFETPAATVFDAQLSYRMGAVQWGLVIHNLADKAYYVPSRYFGGGQVTPAPRRSVAATAQWQF